MRNIFDGVIKADEFKRPKYRTKASELKRLIDKYYLYHTYDYGIGSNVTIEDDEDLAMITKNRFQILELIEQRDKVRKEFDETLRQNSIKTKGLCAFDKSIIESKVRAELNRIDEDWEECFGVEFGLVSEKIKERVIKEYVSPCKKSGKCNLQICKLGVYVNWF